MPSRSSLEVRRFRRAAEERYKEARFLLSHEFTTAAVYLAGYAVECALRALLLWNKPVSRHLATLAGFRGAKAHDFEWLRMQLDQRRVHLPRQMLVHLQSVGRWTTDLRYDPGTLDEGIAREFLNSANELLKWVKGRL